jgi:hypothetical protein
VAASEGAWPPDFAADRRWPTDAPGGEIVTRSTICAALRRIELDYVADERWTVGWRRNANGDGVVHYGMKIPGYGDFAWYSTRNHGPVMWGYRLEGFDTRRLSLGVDRTLGDRETVSLSHERRASRRNEFVYLSETTALRYLCAF